MFLTINLSGLRIQKGIKVNSEIIKYVAEIIKAAAGSKLGIIALMVIVLALLAYHFFKNGPVIFRFLSFILLLAGAIAFGYKTFEINKIKVATNPLDRFDLNTGLLWATHNIPIKSWEGAIELCQDLARKMYSGSTTWRLPTTTELRSFVHFAGEPSFLPSCCYWSSQLGGLGVRYYDYHANPSQEASRQDHGENDIRALCVTEAFH